MFKVPEIISQPCQRAFRVGAIDEKARTVELAFSSEKPVPECWGFEILDHSPGACDLSVLNNGGAVLVEHDMEDHVGVVESAHIDADRIGRALVRFGNGPLASEVFQDVKDGIRRHVSFRAKRLDMVLDSSVDGVDTYRTTKWMPYEISFVAVPADGTVGVGRSFNPTTPGKPTKESTTMDPAAAPAAPAATVPATANKPGDDVVRSNAITDERARVQAILAVGAKFNKPDIARAFCENGKSIAEFNEALLGEINRGGTPVPDQRNSQAIGMTDKEIKRYSIIRAINALANPSNQAAQRAAAFEMEASRAAAEKASKSPRGVMIPEDVLTRAMSTDSTGAASLNPSTGGQTIRTDLLTSSFIEVLRSRSIMAGMGTTLAGLVGNVEIPKQITQAGAVWTGEGVDAGETSIDFTQVGLTPKNVSAFTELTRNLMLQSSMDVEAMVRYDLALAMAKAIDIAALYGTGANGQPKGVSLQSGIGAVPLANVQPTFAELVSMETAVATADADIGSFSYIIRPETRGYAKITARGNGVLAPIMEDNNTLNGYGYRVTNRVQKTGTPATTMDVWFGNWADVLVGLWGGLDMVIDPYTKSKSGNLVVVMHQSCDVAIRHAESFVLAKK